GSRRPGTTGSTQDSLRVSTWPHTSSACSPHVRVTHLSTLGQRPRPNDKGRSGASWTTGASGATGSSGAEGASRGHGERRTQRCTWSS
ncbi:M-agglutinin, partial [Dissostichus eleginoides]